MSWNQSSVCAVRCVRWPGLTTTTLGFGRRVPTWFYSLASSLILWLLYTTPHHFLYLWIWSRGGKCWHVWQPRNVKRTQQRVFLPEPWNQNLFPSHPFGWSFCFPFKHIDSSSSSSQDCRSTGHLFLLPVTAGNEEPNRQFLVFFFCLLIIIWPTPVLNTFPIVLILM